MVKTPKKKKLDRREFIKTSAKIAGASLIGGKVIYDTAYDLYMNHIENKILGSYQYTHILKTKGILDVGGKESKEELLIGGYVKNTEYGQMFFTVAHGLNIETITTPVRTPFGMMYVSTDYPVKEKTSKIGKIELEEIVCDQENDVAILKLPEYANIPAFPFEPEYKTNIGDVIYLIGNPNLQGPVIRKGRIIDLDAMGDKSKPYYNEARTKLTENCFGTGGFDVFTGDSGYPIISEKGKLLGNEVTVFAERAGQIGYVKKIEEFYKHLKGHYLQLEEKIRHSPK